MSHNHLAATGLLAAVAASLHDRDGRRRHALRHGPILGSVTAHSHHGNGSITAPYRGTPVGYQVRLPHGTWVYCRTSCRETLRVETVDIWANVDNGSLIGAGTIQNECGVFGCLDWSFGF